MAQAKKKTAAKAKKDETAKKKAPAKAKTKPQAKEKKEVKAKPGESTKTAEKPKEDPEAILKDQTKTWAIPEGVTVSDHTILGRIFIELRRHPERLELYQDLLSACRIFEKNDSKMAHNANRAGRNILVKTLPTLKDITLAGEYFKQFSRSLLFDAPVDFDAFLQYIELDRQPKDRFYLPRRNTLKQAVDAMQALVDDELDELFIHQPPRTGKTSLLMFFICWILGRNPELANLYSAYSDVITKAMYNGVLEVLGDPDTYLYYNVFPKAKVVSQNAMDETINIDRRKRYASLTCRSLYGTLNGACDCNGMLITDDLIGGIEEVLNKDRMSKTWWITDNNLLTRAKGNAKILWVGTRWSMIDPAGLRQDLLENDERFSGRRYKIINIPALTKDDESNFNYDYGVGFSTEYYHQRRASFERNNDLASWLAQYMGEPIEREGTLFTPEDFRYYNGQLPDGEPDRIFMAVDPAYGGGDYVASPVCYQYGEDIYVHDVVFDNGDKKQTQPLIVNQILTHGVQALQVEASKSTMSYKEEIEERLKEAGYRLNITTKPAPNTMTKNDRIFDKAPEIRDYMIFRETGKRNKAYSLFMNNVFAFQITGKNKHDDAPDSLCMAMDMVLRPKQRLEIFRRPF